ncbi:MAG: DNA alkylation repair protein [Opitutaceae bacterium]|nr:DNA alkylation repair protein [Opitutaceae bacterium]
MAAKSEPDAFKDWFNEPLYRRLARELAAIEPRSDRRRFLALALEGLPERSLMTRMQQTSIAVEAALPGDYAQKIAVLRQLAPRIGHSFIAIFLSDFVARYGHDTAEALEALRFFTRFGSAEFSIRTFLERDLTGTLAVMRRWTTDPDEAVRRLASEGCRPRLPWGRRLNELIRNPEPLRAILEALKDDPSVFVRRSVANNLNDIAKDHPAWVLDLLEHWGTAVPHREWIVRRAARTLVKRGEPRALRLLGAEAATTADFAAELQVSPRRLRLGQPLRFVARITSRAKTARRVIVDYVVHYVRANGSSSPKVFKWTETDLQPRGSVNLAKNQLVRDFTTRRHYAGLHRVDLQVNGRRVASATFQLHR